MTARAVCERCRRPLVVCYCAHLAELPTRTRVIVLQHPREHNMAIGTARMAHLALPSSLLRVGLDFSIDPVVQAALAERPTWVVFPDESAVDVAELPREIPLNLVVIDGTWWQAQKLLKLNPALRALPHVAFSPTRPSAYRIRRQPAEHCVSTVEALAEVLDVLEPEHGPFSRLLDPFIAMVDRQAAFAAETRTGRHRKNRLARGLPPRGTTLGERLAVAWDDLVFVQGEANAWPFLHPDRTPPEVVHWTALRASTGETLEVVVRPRGALAPSTPSHLGLAAETINGGVDVATWREKWSAFVRPTDVIVEWGRFGGDLAFASELPLPHARIDARNHALQHLRRPVGTVEECLALVEASPFPVDLSGRAGQRLAALAGVVGALWSSPRRKQAFHRPPPAESNG